MKLSLGSRMIIWFGFSALAGMTMTELLPRSLDSKLVLLNFIFTFVELNMKQALLACLYLILVMFTIYRGESIFGVSKIEETEKEAETR